MADVPGLDALHDIVVPPEPPLWPPGDGLWVLLALVGVSLAAVWRWRRAQQQRNAYRAAGLALLAQADSVHEVSVVLKRVALAAWPRARVAPLQGADWVRFLNATCAHCRFAPESLARPDTPADGALRDQAARWIRRHAVRGLSPGDAA